MASLTPQRICILQATKKICFLAGRCVYLCESVLLLFGIIHNDSSLQFSLFFFSEPSALQFSMPEHFFDDSSNQRHSLADVDSDNFGFRTCYCLLSRRVTSFTVFLVFVISQQNHCAIWN